ncbi:hypothetical protein GOBAR_DD18817 [Gossypium barbadense]|nr:hypothetical protein GOBAR_DD18817 [Gossypium barbadense]
MARNYPQAIHVQGVDFALGGRNTKKVRFKGCGEGESSNSDIALDLALAMPMSWRDKVMGNGIEGAGKDSGLTGLEDNEDLDHIGVCKKSQLTLIVMS